jgi:hypothetical protein
VDRARLGWARNAAAAAARVCSEDDPPGHGWRLLGMWQGMRCLHTVAGWPDNQVRVIGQVAMWRGMVYSLQRVSIVATAASISRW